MKWKMLREIEWVWKIMAVLLKNQQAVSIFTVDESKLMDSGSKKLTGKLFSIKKEKKIISLTTALSEPWHHLTPRRTYIDRCQKKNVYKTLLSTLLILIGVVDCINWCPLLRHYMCVHVQLLYKNWTGTITSKSSMYFKKRER